ncbi:MAG: dethiobiotin synthase [Vulcanimicrobiaceae bacterium]
MITRFFITGTDTDVGKTRVAAAVALALQRALGAATPLTIVKAVQTGLDAGEPGDAETAARMAGLQIAARELQRFRKPADPYNAALAEGARPVTCEQLAAEIARIDGALVVEGAGGIAVPLNAHETFADLAAMCALPVLIVVGLRLGCINHTLLTAHYLRSLGCTVVGAILVHRWEEASKNYEADVVRCLSKQVPVLAALPYDPAATALADSATQLEEVLCKRIPS